ncbi:YceI family protein [Corynebacterium pacaense]|uniref:YceI family protein n=1 Tax=Corynebacterium pacaense TaxID=1816684 RepID=UPI001FE465B4|nr:YceI family protein [Corynebacterium pacaense]
MVIAIVALALLAVGPMVYKLVMGPGLRTDGIHGGDTVPASTGMDGTWRVVPGDTPNHSSAGFTFAEILPGEQKITSGSTPEVSGSIEVSNDTLTSGLITVDMTHITTDQEKRDINVRMKLLYTDDFPTATFEVGREVDLSAVPGDGKVAQVVIPGELTVHGVTREVSPTFDVLRSGERVIVASDIAINRLDYNVETPDFVAAKIDENGEINVRLTLEK